MRKIGIILVIIALGSLGFHFLGGGDRSLQEISGPEVPVFKITELVGQVLGDFLRVLLQLDNDATKRASLWIFLSMDALLLFAGIACVAKGRINFNPLTVRKFRRFKSLRRGYISFLVLAAMLGLACLDTLIVGKKALVVCQDGRWSFPFTDRTNRTYKDYGIDSSDFVDYRKLARDFESEGKGDWVLMPVIPYAPRLDSDTVTEPLTVKDGRFYLDKAATKPFRGTAFTQYPRTALRHRDVRVKDGLPDGSSQSYDPSGNVIQRSTFKDGAEVSRKAFSAEGESLPPLDPATSGRFFRNLAPPTAPSISSSHYFGTDGSGGDILAQLYGGFQIFVMAAVIYLAFTYSIGIVVGCAMGYFGGLVDLLGQRVIEILSALPFLYLVIFIRDALEPQAVILIAVMSAFAWIGTSYYMRTGTMREKERDYVAASRLLGANSARLIFVHILPNVISTLVTLVPFSISAVIGALSAMDFLGFGLPPGEPSWGALLREGTENMSKPWIISFSSAALVALLILVNFVGEAIREAFDPKRHTYYQ